MPDEKIYDLGKLGVHITPSPTHAPKGSLAFAQNAHLDPEGEEGGLGKRPSMTSFVSSLGSVSGLIHVPIGLTSPKLYAALQATSVPGWQASTDGTTWANDSVIGVPAQSTKIDQLSASLGGLSPNQPCASYHGKVYYPGNDYIPFNDAGHTPPTIRVYDGVTDLQIAQIPYHPGATVGSNSIVITAIHVHRDSLYVATADDSTGTKGRVFELDPVTGTLTQLGESFGTATGELAGGVPWSLASLGQKLFAGTHNLGGAPTAHAYWIRPGVDSTWTDDHTFTTGEGHVLSMVSYHGLLYAGVSADLGLTARVLKRDQAGAWTSSDDMGSTAPVGYDYYDGLVVYQDELYAVRFQRSGTPTFEIRKYDGSSWSTVYDIEANFATRSTVGQPIVFDDKLYVPIPQTTGATAGAGLILENDAGAWSKVDDYSGRGMMAKVAV